MIVVAVQHMIAAGDQQVLSIWREEGPPLLVLREPSAEVALTPEIVIGEQDLVEDLASGLPHDEGHDLAVPSLRPHRHQFAVQAGSGADVEFEIGVTGSHLAQGVGCPLTQGGPSQVGVNEDPGGVDDRLQAGGGKGLKA